MVHAYTRLADLVRVRMHAGLQVLVEDGRVLECHVSRQAAVFYAEVGSAHAILQAGYTLASFMVRHSPPSCHAKYVMSSYAHGQYSFVSPDTLFFYNRKGEIERQHLKTR